jgi:hypothetical protein
VFDRSKQIINAGTAVDISDHWRQNKTMRKIMLFAAIVVFTPTLVSADSATVASGVKSAITTHTRYDSRCQSSPVTIKISAAPANGTVTAETKSVVVPPESDRGIAQQSPCVGKTIDGVVVYYQSNPGFVGQDSFRYQRLNPKDAGDPFNMEISYAITVK